MTAERHETRAEGRLRAPGLGLLLAEARGILELNATLLLSPLVMQAQRGDGHPVLALRLSRRRPAGADLVDLFEARRRGELAYLQGASPRYRREHRGAFCEPCRNRPQSGRADRLAQAEGQFHQFDRAGPFAIAYAPAEQAQSGNI